MHSGQAEALLMTEAECNPRAHPIISCINWGTKMVVQPFLKGHKYIILNNSPVLQVAETWRVSNQFPVSRQMRIQATERLKAVAPLNTPHPQWPLIFPFLLHVGLFRYLEINVFKTLIIFLWVDVGCMCVHSLCACVHIPNMIWNSQGHCPSLHLPLSTVFPKSLC